MFASDLLFLSPSLSPSLCGEVLSQVMSQRVSKLSLGGCQALFQIKRKRLCEVSWKTSLGILSRRCLSFRLSGLALMSHLTTNNCLRRSIVALAATV
ncbi:hypothetical protein C2G38_811198 [Gigaspora rosea]|uniref:Uncharacterized protein n=1 Tax=Gigaspora rosea TaxID=44941 RepID=A0A397U1U7_9GLOM|nr:hypothetical protein C2G38_811198 [Gigaspora rosea]